MDVMTAPFSHLGEADAVQLSQEAAEREWQQVWPPVEPEPAESDACGYGRGW